MRFSSPHDPTDTRAAAPSSPIPAVVIHLDHARPARPGRLSCWTSLRPESDQSRTASATRPARRTSALCRSPGPPSTRRRCRPYDDRRRRNVRPAEADRHRELLHDDRRRGAPCRRAADAKTWLGDTKAFAEAMARMIAAEDPDHYLAVMSTQKRKGKILDDYLRNGRGGRRGMPHATPTTTFAVARPCSR